MSIEREPVVALALERGGGATLHEQLEQRLRDLVRQGSLSPGARLPSSRALALELGVSRGVVLEAYSQLAAEGYITASQGSPTRVALAPSVERPPVPASSLQRRARYDFSPSLPDLSAFPRDRWMRALRAAIREATFDALGGGDPRGAPELRDQLMRYLGRARSAAPEPEHTIVCGGFTQALAALCRGLRDRGVERIAVEGPGWTPHRLIAERAGLEPVAVPVDDRGIDVAALDASGCDTVIVTPGHQYPTGVVLSSERRAELLAWAEDRDALIVEDDYDSELRYDRVPVGALQGLAPERVCHIGSASTRLAPGLRIGWILSPSWLTGALTYEHATADGGTPMLEQLALARFIGAGELDRHLRRMRIRYRARRDALLVALARELPDARATGVPAGTFTQVVLGERLDEPALLSAAARAGVLIDGVGGSDQTALILGYANLPEPAIRRGVALLAEAVRQTRIS